MSNSDFSYCRNPGPPTLLKHNTVEHGVFVGHFEGCYRGMLTIKSVVSGQAVFETPDSRYRLDNTSIVVLNADQPYATDVLPKSETLSIYFQPNFVELVAYAKTAPLKNLLEDPSPTNLPSFEIFERLIPKSESFGTAISTLNSALALPDFETWQLEGHFCRLATEVLKLREGMLCEVKGFVGKGKATREELFRRLYHARDYIHSSFREQLSLSQIARIAHLSPFHFQRMFKAAFGVSPTGYLQARRLSEAKKILESTDLDITSVCHRVGFQSLGTFSSLVRRTFGVSPRELRTARRNKRSLRKCGP